MKIKLLIFLLSLGLFASAQDKYMTKTGHIWFFSATPVENIEAHNRQASGIVDIKTGDVVISALMKSFEFEKALMQEHFNENYVESTKFPKGTFKGKITNLKDINFSKAGKYKATIEGDLTVHGQTKKVKTDASIEVKDATGFHATTKFIVSAEDFKIEIPAISKNNIAKNIDVNVDMNFEPMK